MELILPSLTLKLRASRRLLKPCKIERVYTFQDWAITNVFKDRPTSLTRQKMNTGILKKFSKIKESLTRLKRMPTLSLTVRKRRTFLKSLSISWKLTNSSKQTWNKKNSRNSIRGPLKSIGIVLCRASDEIKLYLSGMNTKWKSQKF